MRTHQQNHQLRRHTVPVCTVSSPMKINAMYSGIAGTAKPAVINAHRDWHTIVKHVSACGPIKYQNAEMKASFNRATNIRTFFTNHCLFVPFVFIVVSAQRLPTVSVAQLQEKLQMPVHSRVMLIQKIAVNTTFAWKVLPVNTVARSAQYSKLATVMAPVTAKIQKMFPDGKCFPIFILFSVSLRKALPSIELMCFPTF